LTFHWEIEFPEVFTRTNPGFDVFIGNPPFAGKNTITASNGPNYLQWLLELHEESHGNADVVAHFYRRAFSLLRTGAHSVSSRPTQSRRATRAAPVSAGFAIMTESFLPRGSASNGPAKPRSSYLSSTSTMGHFLDRSNSMGVQSIS